MWQNVQTYILVTIITVLVWLYAESSTLQTDTIHPTIEFVEPTGQELLIEPKRPREQISVEIQGPTSQLQELDRLLNLGPIRLPLLEGPEPSQAVDLYEELSAYLAEDTPGIRVIAVEPATVVKVRVERYDTKMLPIALDTGGHLVTKAPPRFKPDQAAVKAPVTWLAGLDDDATLIAQLGPNELTLLVKDEEMRVTVKLTPPAALAARDSSRITITPENVDITITITEKTETCPLKPIPIFVRKPMSADRDYAVIRVDADQGEFLSGIEVKGPAESIAQIKDGDLKVWAELRLTNQSLAENAGGDAADGQVTVVTPPGVAVINPPQPIKYKVVRRIPSAAGAGRAGGLNGE